MIKIEVKTNWDDQTADITLNIDNQAWQTICHGVTIAESVEKVGELRKAIPSIQVWLNGERIDGD